MSAAEEERLVPGVVMTIEPGLYYPERAWACAWKTALYVHPDGRFEILAPYPLDLVLPVKEKALKRTSKKIRIDRNRGDDR